MRAIFIMFKDRFEAFTSLKPFLQKYPEYLRKKASIEDAISRNKKPYVGEEFTLVRLNLQKAKK